MARTASNRDACGWDRGGRAARVLDEEKRRARAAVAAVDWNAVGAGWAAAKAARKAGRGAGWACASSEGTPRANEAILASVCAVV